MSSTFTDAELAYLTDRRRLGRLATVDPEGRPQNTPVNVHYEAESDVVYIVGWRMSSSRKFRNIRNNPYVAVVLDDVPSWSPLHVRGLEIRGWAEALDGDEVGSGDGRIRIHAERVLAWGLEAAPDRDASPAFPRSRAATRA